jgi:Heavy-metal resistance
MLKKLFVIGLVCASLGLAQRGGGGGKKGGDEGGGGMGMQSAPTKLDRIALTLILTKDQKKAVKTILDDGAKEAAPLREQISKSRIAVGEAIVAKKSDDELKQAGRASSDLATKLSELELQTFAKVVASLDDSQKVNKPALGQVLAMMTNIFHEKNWNED